MGCCTTDEYANCIPAPKHTPLSTPKLRYFIPKINMCQLSSFAELSCCCYNPIKSLATASLPESVDTHSLLTGYLCTSELDTTMCEDLMPELSVVSVTDDDPYADARPLNDADRFNRQAFSAEDRMRQTPSPSGKNARRRPLKSAHCFRLDSDPAACLGRRRQPRMRKPPSLPSGKNAMQHPLDDAC